MSTPQRLQRILASAGVASRRSAEELITAGRVSVNGQIVTELGTRADPDLDAIALDGRLLTRPELAYLAMFKPTGFLTTRDDPKGRRTVMDLAPQILGLHPVGRLDYDTSGLLILTNDGDFTLAMTHPRYGVPKTYEALIEGVPSERALQQLREGIAMEGSHTAPAQVVLLGQDPPRLRLTIHEGRNRQVRRMCEAIGHPVIRLKRISVGPIGLDGMAPGDVRPLTGEEVAALRALSRQEEIRS